MEYADLLAAAKRNPATADFTELRLAYARSSEYAPYPFRPLEKALGAENIRSPEHGPYTIPSLEKALDENNMQGAIEAINRILETRYLDRHVHATAAFVYEKIGDEARSTYHRKFAEGLLESIRQSGDGLSYETAFIVIDVREEYLVLGVLDAELIQQSLTEHGGHQFDVLEVRDRRTGQTAAQPLYFNIDLPVQRLNTWNRDVLRNLTEEPEDKSELS